MPAFICVTCGTQFAPSDVPPPACPICEDERQFVPSSGQSWTTLEKLRQSHTNAWRRYEDGLLGLGTVPSFGIGQRAFLVRTRGGNVLWDCIALIDEATIELIRALGGLRAVAISHPHYYTTMLDWAEAFDCPVHLHAADREWVMRLGPALRFWDGDTSELAPGLTLIRAGGHFAGGTMLHWAGGADGKGALLSGDIFQVVPDRRHVSFMWSYPNLLPLSAATVRSMARIVDPFAYDAVYGAFWGREIREGGRQAVAESVERYLRCLGEGAGGNPA